MEEHLERKIKKDGFEITDHLGSGTKSSIAVTGQICSAKCQSTTVNTGQMSGMTSRMSGRSRREQ